MKTIKQTADEIEVSKDKVKYQVGKLPSNYLVKVGKITHLTDEGTAKIKEIMMGKTVVNLPSNNREITQFLPSEENELYKMLKIELEAKNNLIQTLQEELTNERTHSREQANKLADLASELAELNRNNQILLGSEQTRNNPAFLQSDEEKANENNTACENKGFWSRVFSRNKN